MTSIPFQGHFGDTTREERQKILEDFYSFRCSCEACTKNFPLAKDLPKTYEDSFTQGSSLELSKLKELDARHVKIGEDIMAALEANDLERVQELYGERLRLAGRDLPNPHMIFLSNRSGLLDAIWLRFGNRNFSARNETLKGVYL